VVTAANTTLVSVLLGEGTSSSTEQLLVLLQGNASLGHQVSQPIRLGRPLVLAGFWSVPTGIDFEMKVNHLVSSQHNQFYASTAQHSTAHPVRARWVVVCRESILLGKMQRLKFS